ncbi:MAG: hypothetical protein CMQ75_04735 [Gammaproteobacteria bacterium]|nr:hypothetical protein [Gammaproteobacteria bacterium]
MKNLKKTFFLLIILKTNAIFALADTISPKDLQEFYSDSATKKEVLLYFRGAGDGILWANTLNEEEQICLPPDQAFYSEDYYSIYKTEYLRQKDLYDSLEYQPPGLLLFNGFIHNFPCE